VQTGGPSTAKDEQVQPWYTRTPADVAEALGVDPAVGLPSAIAAERLRTNGPNALPEERATPGRRRFLDQYRSWLLGTTEINLVQFLWAVVPAVGLLVAWELGKLVARRSVRHEAARPVDA